MQTEPVRHLGRRWNWYCVLYKWSMLSVLLSCLMFVPLLLM